MTDPASQPLAQSSLHTGKRARKRLRARYRAEWIFKTAGLSAIGVALSFLLFLFTTIFIQGFPAFTYNFARLDLQLNATTLGNQGEITKASIGGADYDSFVRDAIRAQFPEVKGRSAKRALSGLMSSGAPVLLREALLADPELASTGDITLPLSDFADLYLKGQIT
ncbi:MAG: DUF3333 domain-containing protein, partial [Henriciella sp.]|nr:DUF3333 domain-containing protein [Henriciella sp.]